MFITHFGILKAFFINLKSVLRISDGLAYKHSLIMKAMKAIYALKRILILNFVLKMNLVGMWSFISNIN